MRFGGGKGLSLTAILLIVGIGWITGQDPLQILGQLTGQMGQQSAPATTQTRKAPPANDEGAEFVRSILGDTEDTWRQIFQQAGRQYKDPTLVLFSNRVNSACGLATSATGPFYCPADQKVYLDMAFLPGNVPTLFRRGRLRPGLRDRSRSRTPCADLARCFRENSGRAPARPADGRRWRLAGAPGTASRLPGRRLGQPCTEDG